MSQRLGLFGFGGLFRFEILLRTSSDIAHFGLHLQSNQLLFLFIVVDLVAEGANLGLQLFDAPPLGFILCGIWRCDVLFAAIACLVCRAGRGFIVSGRRRWSCRCCTALLRTRTPQVGNRKRNVRLADEVGGRRRLSINRAAKTSRLHGKLIVRRHFESLIFFSLRQAERTLDPLSAVCGRGMALAPMLARNCACAPEGPLTEPRRVGGLP